MSLRYYEGPTFSLLTVFRLKSAEEEVLDSNGGRRYETKGERLLANAAAQKKLCLLYSFCRALAAFDL